MDPMKEQAERVPSNDGAEAGRISASHRLGAAAEHPKISATPIADDPVPGRRRLPISILSLAPEDEHGGSLYFPPPPTSPADLMDAIDALSKKPERRFEDVDILDIAAMKGIEFSKPAWWRKEGYDLKNQSHLEDEERVKQSTVELESKQGYPPPLCCKYITKVWRLWKEGAS